MCMTFLTYRGGERAKHTGSNQRSWVLLEHREKYLATDRKPKKKTFPKTKP